MPTQPPSPNLFWLWPKRRCPFSELRGAMCDKLDVFLQKETKNFVVDYLFVTLETNSYLQSNPEPPGAAAQAEAPNLPIAATAAIIPAAEEVSKSCTNAIVKTERDSRTSSIKGKPVYRAKRRSWPLRSRSRSRSRERTGRQQRSRSSYWSSRGNRGDRGCRGGLDANPRSLVESSRQSDRNRPRSPLPYGRRSRCPTNSSSRRPRSPSGPTKNKQSSDIVPPSDNAATSTTEVTPSIGVCVPLVASVIVALNAKEAVAVGGNKFRCRDYDEKGFYMHGDLYPYDHGGDPAVLDNVDLSSLLNYIRRPPSTVVLRSVAAALAVAGSALPPPVHLRRPPPSLPPGESYNPDAPVMSWPPPPNHLVGPHGNVPLRPIYRGGPPPHKRGMHSRPIGLPSLRGPPTMGLLGPYLHPFDPGAGLREFISMPTAGLGNLMDDVEHYGGGGKRSMNDAGLDEDCCVILEGLDGFSCVPGRVQMNWFSEG